MLYTGQTLDVRAYAAQYIKYIISINIGISTNHLYEMPPKNLGGSGAEPAAPESVQKSTSRCIGKKQRMTRTPSQEHRRDGIENESMRYKCKKTAGYEAARQQTRT